MSGGKKVHKRHFGAELKENDDETDLLMEGSAWSRPADSDLGRLGQW